MSKKTNVAFLLDQTGSMEFCKSDTIGGFNNFLSDQKKLKNNISFSLTLFNSGDIEKRYVNENIAEIKKLSNKNYCPANMTPLWDAIGSTINEIGNKKNLLFIILSDGEENCSREFSSETVKTMIETKEKKGWKFLFLGANLSDFGQTLSVGIRMNITTDKGNMRQTYNNVSCMVANYCRTGDVVYDGKNKEKADAN